VCHQLETARPNTTCTDSAQFLECHLCPPLLLRGALAPLNGQKVLNHLLAFRPVNAVLTSSRLSLPSGSTPTPPSWSTLRHFPPPAGRSPSRHEADDDPSACQRRRLAPFLLLDSRRCERTGVADVVPGSRDPPVGALDVGDA